MLENRQPNERNRTNDGKVGQRKSKDRMEAGALGGAVERLIYSRQTLDYFLGVGHYVKAVAVLRRVVLLSAKPRNFLTLPRIARSIRHFLSRFR